MFLRVFTFLLLTILCTSCDNFSFLKKTNKQVLDTIVDFSSVDTSPSFKACDSLIDKEKKATCFRTTIHQQITNRLSTYSMEVKHAIDETIFVQLIISPKGNIEVVSIKKSEIINKELPELDSLLRLSVKSLPKVFPATKRGIKITTQYQLPIRIQLKE
jgi:hypothetical protein